MQAHASMQAITPIVDVLILAYTFVWPISSLLGQPFCNNCIVSIKLIFMIST